MFVDFPAKESTRLFLIVVSFLGSCSPNDVCPDDKTKGVALNITDSSSWVSTVVNGQPIALFCCTSGYENILWYRQISLADPYQSFDDWVNNCPELNPKANPDVKLTEENQTLYFNPAQIDRLKKSCGDDGWYTCVASDGKGNSQNRTFNLQVSKCSSNVKPLELQSDSCRNQEASIGQPVTFICNYSLCAYSPFDYEVNGYKILKNKTTSLPDDRYNFISEFVRLTGSQELDRIYTHLSLEKVKEEDYHTDIFIQVENSAGEGVQTQFQIKKPSPYPDYFLPLVIVGSLVGLVSIAVAIIAWWNLEFQLLLRGIMRTFPWPDDTRGKEYDGFVLNDFGYNAPGDPSEEDHQFIMEKLVTNVEEKWGYRLFIWRRVQDSADYSGKDISTAIQEIMRKSRRIIILLSPNFINRGWPSITIPQVSSSLENFPKQVIIIKFKEISQDQLENFQLREQLGLLSMIVRTIKWDSGNRHRVERFWKELRLGMPTSSIQEIRQRKHNNEQQRAEMNREQEPLL